MDKAKSPRKVSPWYTGLGSLSLVAVLFAGGTLASRKIGTERALDIAAKHHIATTAAELYPPYKGDPSQNAFEIVAHLSSAKALTKATAPTLDGPFDLAQAKAVLASERVALELSDQLAQRPDYVPKHEGELLTMTFMEYGQLKRAAFLLGTRGRIRAVEGDLGGALGDFEKVVSVANFIDHEPSVIGSCVNVAIANRLLRTIVETSPAFRGQTQEFARLRAIPAKLHPVNFARGLEGDAAFALSLATHRWDAAALGMSGDNGALAEASYFEATRAFWGPAVVQCWADDLEAARKTPSDLNSPRFSFQNMKKLVSSGGPAGRIAELICPAGSDFGNTVTSATTYKQLAVLSLAAIEKGVRPDVSKTHDPFGSGPYHLLTSNGGWAVYSVGEDRIDNGGRVKANDDKQDIVVRMADSRVTMDGK